MRNVLPDKSFSFPNVIKIHTLNDIQKLVHINLDNMYVCL